MKSKILPLLLLPLWLCSCATFAKREGVQVSLVNLQFGEATVWETTVLCTVRIQNELPEPVIMDGAMHKIYLNGAYIGDGLSNERIDIPRLSSVTQKVTVHLHNISILVKLRGIAEAQAADYKLTSLLYTAEQGRFRTAHEGRIDLKDFRPAQSVSPTP